MPTTNRYRRATLLGALIAIVRAVVLGCCPLTTYKLGPAMLSLVVAIANAMPVSSARRPRVSRRRRHRS